MCSPLGSEQVQQLLIPVAPKVSDELSECASVPELLALATEQTARQTLALSTLTVALLLDCLYVSQHELVPSVLVHVMTVGGLHVRQRPDCFLLSGRQYLPLSLRLDPVLAAVPEQARQLLQHDSSLALVKLR